MQIPFFGKGSDDEHPAFSKLKETMDDLSRSFDSLNEATQQFKGGIPIVSPSVVEDSGE